MTKGESGPGRRWSRVGQLAAILKECLEEGKQVDIDGLGIFRPRPRGRFEFVPHDRPKVFLAYVQEDAAPAGRLFERLRAGGFDPWMDRRKLLPGQNWPRSIEDAIETCDFFLACFSRRSVSKKGGFQAEIRYALDCARRVPLDDTFLIPLRLDECRVPARIRNEIQYLDLFPDWERGFRRVVRVMERQLRKRRRTEMQEPRAA
ncbi:MAG: TIR domain-containing protein [Bryobacterales bacterium]|nr:TIR domain-containing protein [Bryobacterales bacterium]